MHHVCQVGLDLRLLNIDDFKAILDEELMAFNSLGTLRLPPIVGLNLAHQCQDARLIG